MTLVIVVGTQWGDEGKGRIVDLLAAEAAVVARYNGGDNAGHTVTVGSQTFKLHLLPAGLIHPHTFGVLGNGMVVNPISLLKEMEMLRAFGIVVDPERLMISYAAHLITPGHKALDAAQERARGAGQIGTTGRGIGPAYTDKAARRGLRLLDMLDPVAFREKMRTHIREANVQLHAFYHAELLEIEAIAAEFEGYAEVLKPYIGDPGAKISEALAAGKVVLAEGAQGTLLDLDHGTYPFVTSSNPTAPGALTGLGLGMQAQAARVVGVTKSFQTRVGAGPFPTEVHDQAAERLRGSGANPWDEFGTTTGRPRRVGWLDGVLLRYAVRINGLTELVVTKLDVLSGLATIPICTAYRSQGRQLRDLPLGPSDLSPFEPIFDEELPGWQEDLTGARTWADLPVNARGYLEKIAEISGVKVSLVSVGPERDQIVKCEA
jgi:adenylosuccinate synthase